MNYFMFLLGRLGGGWLKDFIDMFIYAAAIDRQRKALLLFYLSLYLQH